MAETVQSLLRQLIAQDVTKKAVAKRLGRSRQWLDSVLKGASAGAEVCMRLARQERLNPLDLLRAEGHDELADELIAAGFNASQVPEDDRAFLAAYHALTAKQRHHVRALIESVADVGSRPASRLVVDAPAVAPPRARRRRR